MSGTTLVTVPLSTPGRLTPSAAASFERLIRDAKTTGTTQANHAWRSYADQVDLWNIYMTTNWAASDKVAANARSWNGKTWYRKPGRPAVAIPGKSNHGDADTVDFQNIGSYGSASWNRFAASAAAHGWNNVEGRSVNEPWHWTYVFVSDQHRNDPLPKPPKPEPKDTDVTLILTAKTSYNIITAGWNYLVTPDGILRALDVREFNALKLGGAAVYSWDGDDINDLAQRNGLYEFTGNPSLPSGADPLGLTGAIIGRDATAENKGGTSNRAFPKVRL